MTHNLNRVLSVVIPTEANQREQSPHLQSGGCSFFIGCLGISFLVAFPFLRSGLDSSASSLPTSAVEVEEAIERSLIDVICAKRLPTSYRRDILTNLPGYCLSMTTWASESSYALA